MSNTYVIMKPFLILQLRELDEAADQELEAFLHYGKLMRSEVRRIRMERESFVDINVTDYSAVIVGGGPSNVSDEAGSKPDYQRRFEAELNILFDQIFDKDIPYLGNCYGLGAIIKYAGGEVSKEKHAEAVGTTLLKLNEKGKQDPLLQGLPNEFSAFCGHKEASQSVPAGGILLGSSDGCPVQIVKFKRNVYAVQFHCELDASGLIERIGYYKHHGYFEPDAADALIEKTKSMQAEIPQLILRRFVDRYRSAV